MNGPNAEKPPFQSPFGDFLICKRSAGGYLVVSPKRFSPRLGIF